jgi:uncharacterized protein YndB with AHSA1/START domain
MTMGREFEITRDVEIQGTPEQVWDAVATGPGLASWMFPSPIEGGGEGGPIQVWDPPNHLAIRMEGEGGWFNALEYTIEGRAGGTTALRYVHSGIFDDEGWDDQYDAVNQHTDFYLHTLGQYVAHFSPKTATYIGDMPGGIDGPEASMAPDGFDRLKGALGIAGASEGDSVQADLDGVGRLDGVVDYLRGNFAGIRTADALYRFFGRNAFGGPVGMQVHHFGDADAEATKQALKGWLDGVYA